MLGEIKWGVITREEGNQIIQPGEESKEGGRGEGLRRGMGVAEKGGKCGEGERGAQGAGHVLERRERAPARGGKQLSATLTPHHGRPPLPAAAITGRRRAAVATGPGGAAAAAAPGAAVGRLRSRRGFAVRRSVRFCAFCVPVLTRPYARAARSACVPGQAAKWLLYNPEVSFLLLRLLLTPFFGWSVISEMLLPQAYVFRLSFV